ncbi:MAG TPA: decaprenyl-phosphate phosphoribosyltransferase [Desulfuromonadales bacterium]|nr:decaprenyl-phosphate phosphoribosyltransferase [Desulfuromonadales bacterium]
MKVKAYFRLLRPHQWLKNLILLFPPFLGGDILRPGLLVKGLLPIAAFCLASSGTYIINDIFDRLSDLSHPRKKLRPLPAGQISVPVASFLAIALLAGGGTLGLLAGTTFFFILLAYLCVTLAYSMGLKHVAVLELFCIPAGFLLRLKAGGVAFDVPVSAWLFLTVFLLALFLATGKRLGEKSVLGEAAEDHRRALSGYPAGYLDGTMFMTGAAVLVTYTLYILSKHFLVYTVPLCAFGLLRYILLVKDGQQGDPTDALVRDPFLFAVGLVWVGMVYWGIYGGG